MTSALVQRVRALPITKWSEVEQIGRVLAASGYFEDAKDAAKAMTKILAGLELGVGPIAALTGIDIIEKKVSYSANLLAALIRDSGRYDYRVVDLTNERCELAFFAGPTQIGSSTFTIKDAEAAGLMKGANWQRYPRNMLFARAMTNGQAWFCPDVTHGARVYDPEELGGGEAAELPEGASPAGGQSMPAEPGAPASSADDAPPAAGDQGPAGTAARPAPAGPSPGLAAWNRLFRENAVEADDEARERVKAVLRAHGVDPKAKGSLEALADVRLYALVRDDVCRQFARPLHHGFQREAAGPAFLNYDVPSRSEDLVRHVVIASDGRHECDCPVHVKGKRELRPCHHVTQALLLCEEDALRFGDVRDAFTVLLALDIPAEGDEAAADRAWAAAEEGLRELASE